MARNKVIAGIGALVLAASIACNVDRAPVAPASGASARLAWTQPPATGRDGSELAPSAGTIGEATSILRTRPLAADLTVSRVIGPQGGRLEIAEAGLRVEVPRGAVRTPTTLTVTALKGDMVAYEFGPDGSRFAIPLLVIQDTQNTNLAELPELAIVQAGYFTGPEMLDQTTKRARLAEVLPTYGLKVHDHVGFLVTHFSGYIIHWGFKPGNGGESAPD